MTAPERIRQRKKRLALEAFARTGSVTRAMAAIGAHRSLHYFWLKDPAYAAAFEQAREQAIDALEDEALRRAVEGVGEPVYQGGALVGEVRRYSDALLIFLLKSVRPDKYRERWAGEIRGAAAPPPPGGDVAAILGERLEDLAAREQSVVLALEGEAL